jgi:hypothetical protein
MQQNALKTYKMYITRAKQDELTNNTSCFYLSNNSGSDVPQKGTQLNEKSNEIGKIRNKELTFKAPPTLGVEEQVEKEIESSSASWMLAHGHHGRADEGEVEERRWWKVS